MPPRPLIPVAGFIGADGVSRPGWVPARVRRRRAVLAALIGLALGVGVGLAMKHHPAPDPITDALIQGYDGDQAHS